MAKPTLKKVVLVISIALLVGELSQTSSVARTAGNLISSEHGTGIPYHAISSSPSIDNWLIALFSWAKASEPVAVVVPVSNDNDGNNAPILLCRPT